MPAAQSATRGRCWRLAPNVAHRRLVPIALPIHCKRRESQRAREIGLPSKQTRDDVPLAARTGKAAFSLVHTAMFSFQGIDDLLRQYGYAAVFTGVMLESIGLPLPGES